MDSKPNQEKQTKQRRGAPRGNKNAAGNRGNRNASGVFGNRGGKGAPRGNRFAQKECKPHEDLMRRYGHDAELVDWIRANAALIDEADFTSDDRRDRAYHQMAALGISFEDLLLH